MSDVQKASEALNEQDAITAGHLIIRATLKKLRQAVEKDSFALREVEATIREASRKGDVRKMQINLPVAIGLTRTSRNALDAALMLIDRCEKGLDENARQREEIAALKAAAAKKDGILVNA